MLTACNVENASYGLTLCAECGLVSALHATGGGRLVAVACVDGKGRPLVPCGRCRQLLHEHGGPELLFNQRPLAELLPDAFGPDHLRDTADGRDLMASSIAAIDLILTKRDGGRLTDEQIDWFIAAYTDGTVADEQAAALLMAILFRGIEPDELARWTQQMIATGTRADLSALDRPTVDKHSTGGVGDKVSLVLCPLVAACGAAVPQTAGRGLGHTGGTLDKMETIPGLALHAGRRRGGPDPARRRRGDQRGRSRPGSRRPQALRPARRHRHGRVDPAHRQLDHVEEDRRGHRRPRARREGRQRRVHEGHRPGARAGRDDGRPRRGPRRPHHGAAHRRWTCRSGGRPATPSRWRRRSRCWPAADRPTSSSSRWPSPARCSTWSGIDADPADALDRRPGHGRLAHHGARPGRRPGRPPPPSRGGRGRHGARHRHAVGSTRWPSASPPGASARARARKEDAVSPIAGVVWRATVGDHVEEGQPLLELHLDDPVRLDAALDALDGAVEISPDPVDPPPMILGRVT